jgi:hypothetical protein
MVDLQNIYVAITPYLRRTVIIYAEYTQYLRSIYAERLLFTQYLRSIYAVFTRCVNSTTPTTPVRKFCVNNHLRMILRIYAQSSLLMGAPRACNGMALSARGQGARQRLSSGCLFLSGCVMAWFYSIGERSRRLWPAAAWQAAARSRSSCHPL